MFAWFLAAAAAGPVSAQAGPEAARALALELSRTPRLAGTIGSHTGAEVVARWLAEAGWQVELDERVVLLNYPRRTRLAVFAGAGQETPLYEQSARFDPDAIPPGDVPPYSAWSPSAHLRARVVDAGRGLRADFEGLRRAGVDLKGALALVRYGGSYRGCKVELAAEFGCAGVLLFSDPVSDGEGKGPTWPAGPWKPDLEAQRGSILSVARAPGDPTTPAWPSPAPREKGRRVGGEELERMLPAIPCLPIGARVARAIQAQLAERELPGPDGLTLAKRPVGPGPVEVELELEQPHELRTIVNVVARLEGQSGQLVLAGNHRDAWVRGMNDAGSGTLPLVMAARELGARARDGWQPRHGLVLGFWDAEEFGLIGSTEWAEAHAAELRERALVYVNADTLVSGTQFSASGSPGMAGVVARALARVPISASAEASLAEAWLASRADKGFEGDLPGSGSDFAVFQHHLGLPVLDLGLHGNGGGQYHTAFDDFAVVDRFLDPGWQGHALAARVLTELLTELSGDPRGGFDAREAAQALERMARSARGDGRLAADPAAWDALADAAAELAGAGLSCSGPEFYRWFEQASGLLGRAWFKNRLWAPGLESGYGSETWPSVAAQADAGARRRELEDLARRCAELSARAGAPTR